MKEKAILLICGFWAMFCIPAIGTTIYVDDNGPADFNNIQAAIYDANDGDTIIVAPGTYTGEGNRGIMIRKSITLISEQGPNSCIIDCDRNSKGFHFYGGEEIIEFGSTSGGNQLIDIIRSVGFEKRGL